MENFIKLIIKDNDSKTIWGGKLAKTNEAPDYKVNDLQDDLKKVGTYTSNIDGDFGNKTLKALKIFQWSCANITAYANKNNGQVMRALKSSIFATGELNKASYDELRSWVKNHQLVTGDLIKVKFSDFSNMEAGSGFKKITSISVQTGEMVISNVALQLLKDINSQAKAKSVTIIVNQTFRVHGVKVTGAVVIPATKSQHLIGHALDCNIVDGNNWNNSLAFKNNKATDNAKKLIEEIKKLGYRWGGNFDTVDTPHFDKNIRSTDFSYDAKFFLNQRMVSEGQTIPRGLVAKGGK